MNDDTLGDILANTAWMRRLAQRLVADAAERDEVVQAVWVQALLHAPATENLRPWLAAVLRNVVRMRFRGEARQKRREEAAPTVPSVPATPEELVDRVEVERDVASALLELGEPYRATLLLRYYEDLSAARIAERLGIPAATVRSRLKRGLDELRARLDARQGGDRRRWALALVPSAAAARAGTVKTIAAAIGGALIMKTAVKVTIAAAILLLLGWGSAIVWRGLAPGNEVTRTRAGVAWHVPGGIGVPGHAPATVDGTRIPAWFGQPGAAVRRVAGRVTADGAPVAGATVELGSALSDAGLLPPATRRTDANGRFDFGLVPPAPYSLTGSAPIDSADVREVDTRDPRPPPMASSSGSAAATRSSSATSTTPPAGRSPARACATPTYARARACRAIPPAPIARASIRARPRSRCRRAATAPSTKPSRPSIVPCAAIFCSRPKRPSWSWIHQTFWMTWRSYCPRRNHLPKRLPVLPPLSEEERRVYGLLTRPRPPSTTSPRGANCQAGSFHLHFCS